MLLGNTYTIPNIVNLPGQSGGIDYGDDFVFVMQTDAPGETIKLRGNGANGIWYDYDIDWGDGITETYLFTQTVTHTYANAGDHTIRISGQYGGFRSDNAAYTTRKITKVLNWGKTGFYWWAYMFTDQPRLVSIPDIVAYDWTASSIGPVPGTPKKNFLRAFASTIINPSVPGTNNGPKLTRCVIKDTPFDTFGEMFRGVVTCEYLEISNCTQDPAVGTQGQTNINYYLGSQTTNGTTVILEDIVFNPTATIDLTGFLRRTKIKSLTINNFDTSATVNNGTNYQNYRYFFEGVEFTTPDINVEFNAIISDAPMNMEHFAQFILGKPNTLDFSGLTTGPSGRINVYELSYFLNQLNATTADESFKFVEGLNKFKAQTGYDFNGTYAFRFAGNLTFPKTSVTKNFASDFLHSGVISGNLQNFFQLHNTEYLGTTSPNCANWDTSMITAFNASFYNIKFDGDFTLNWDMSQCSSFYAMFFLSGCVGTNTELDLSGVTWPSTLPSVRFDQVFQNSSFGKIKMSSFPSNIYTVQRTFDTNDEINDVAFDLLDFSNITTSNDDFSRLTWDRNPIINTTTYAKVLSSMKTLTQPVTAPQGGMVQDMGGNAEWPSGNIYAVRQGAITVTTGTTTITDASATFQTDGVVAGDVYRMQNSADTGISYYIIQSVDSETQLTLANPTVDNRSFYNIFTSQEAKDFAANYVQNGGKFRIIVDGGPIIT